METKYDTYYVEVVIVLLLVFTSCCPKENLYAKEDFKKDFKQPDAANSFEQNSLESNKSGLIYRNPRVYNVEYSFEMFPDPNKIDRSKDLKLWVPIPREWDSQKAVKIISVEPEPHAKYVDPEYGNPMLFWDFGKEPEKPSYKVNLKYRVEGYETHADIDPERIGSYDKTSQDYALYTRSTRTVGITPKVKQLAQIAIGDEKNPYLQAKRIYEFVREKMYYRMPDQELRGKGTGIETILKYPVIDQKTGEEHYTGVCLHHSIVFVALCRAVGIPARNLLTFWDHRPWIWIDPDGLEPTIRLRKRSTNGLTIFYRLGLGGHHWPEIYLPNYGWVPVDPTLGVFGHSNTNNRAVIITKGCDIKIGPYAPQEVNGGYGVLDHSPVPLYEGRAICLFRGVFHTSNIQKVKIGTLHRPDPFPADSLAEYMAKLYPKTGAEKDLALYRKRTLRWIDRNTREHTDKIAALAQAYKKEPKARYEHEAFICHMLRKVVGDKKFFDIFETYTNLRVKSGEAVSTERFKKIAEDTYGKPLDWFFKQWVGYTELPQLQLDAVTFSEEKESWCVRGRLRQLNDLLFRLPVELAIETEKTTEQKTLWLENRNTNFEFITANRPKSVLVDPNNDILQIREMPPLLERSSYDEVAYCIITDQDKADCWGWTPLHFAAEAGQTDIVEFLTANGADVNAENIRGQTPLQFAVDEGHREVVKLLIEKGADISLDRSGETPLQIAVRGDHKEIAKLLIEKGADVSLLIAAYMGNLAKVRSFIEKGADVNAEDEREDTALCYAVKSGKVEVVQLLVEAGADVNAGAWPPLCEAVDANNVSIADYLIAHGANVNAPEGWMPLQEAPYTSSVEMVELLIAKGANVNAGPWTALHSAAAQARRDITELLIANGANVNTRDGDGRTPLWYAKEKGYKEIVELLLKHGAKE